MTDRRLTQEVVEAPARLAPTDNPRRLTQLVIEVAYVNPSQPFSEALIPQGIEWSPAFAGLGDEGQALTYASYFGPHSQEIVLGARGTRIRFLRK